MASQGPLIIATAPREWVEVRRRGRFTVPREVALDPRRMLAATQEAQEQFIKGMKLQGLLYIDKGFEVEGPFAALDFSGDTTPDRGPEDQPPDLRDTAAVVAWEEQGRRLAAKREDYGAANLDFVLIGHFWRQTRAYKTVLGGSPVWIQ